LFIQSHKDLNKTKEMKMKKVLIALAVIVFATVGLTAADAVKTDVKADAKPIVKAEAVTPAIVAPVATAVVCADCAKLNKDLKAGEVAKLCPACQKKIDEAKKTAKSADTPKTTEIKK
jgi:hypothetical protein